MFDKDKKGFITILDVQRVLEVMFPCVLLVSFLSLLSKFQSVAEIVLNNPVDILLCFFFLSRASVCKLLKILFMIF